jgi:hypothetical protein
LFNARLPRAERDCAEAVTCQLLRLVCDSRARITEAANVFPRGRHRGAPPLLKAHQPFSPRQIPISGSAAVMANYRLTVVTAILSALFRHPLAFLHKANGSLITRGRPVRGWNCSARIHRRNISLSRPAAGNG